MAHFVRLLRATGGAIMRRSRDRRRLRRTRSQSVRLGGLPAQLALLESPDLSPSTPASELPLGVPAASWLDLRGYDSVAVAAGLSIPIFISQGSRDYQVPPSELLVWRAGLASHPGVTIHEYPALNHLLLAGSGPSRPAEYAVPGHVDVALVNDLAAWVIAAP